MACPQYLSLLGIILSATSMFDLQVTVSGYERLKKSLVRGRRWKQLSLVLVIDKYRCETAETHDPAKYIYPVHRSPHSVLTRLEDCRQSHPLEPSAH